MPGGAAKRLAAGALIASAMALVAWVRLLPLSLDGIDDAARADVTYRAADGREYVYLGDLDSYAWLRSAATLLRSGTTCDAVVDGQCRDTYADAPVGRVDLYRGSLHVAAIAGLHRLAIPWWPKRPLSASAFLVPVIVGALGVLPAFALGRRLAGSVGGWCAAVLIGVNPLFLARSIGADNDVWNVVLPLFMVWAASAALSARRLTGQIAGAVAAAAAAALQATVWRGWMFTYDLLLVALLLQMLVAALGHVRRRRDPRIWRAAAVRRAALVFGVFSVATGVFTAAGGREASYLRAPLALLESIRSHLETRPPALAAAEAVHWPDMLGTVAEAAVPTLADIAKLVGGQVVFFAGWLGLLLLVLPRRGWRVRHFAVLLGGNSLYRYLLHAVTLTRTELVAWLAAPLVVAVPMQAAAADDDQDAATAMTVVLWFLAALYLSYEAVRMVLLLVAPFGLALGAALGRLYEWLSERVVVWLPRAPRFAAALPLALIAALVWVPIQRGAALARGAAPEMNDAWWETLVALREQSPPDAIVTTWWDFGYWVKYVAERRTSADGGSLLTRIPLWTAQALMAADETESVGLLRMLDCGSDPRDSSGAFGTLLADGVAASAAYEALRQIARSDAATARGVLDGLGVQAPTRNRVLAATRCAPPAAYLVLSSRTIVQDAWRQLGSWNPRRSDAAPATMFGSLLTPAWISCEPGEAGALVCPIDGVIDGTGTRLEAVRVDTEHPAASRLRLHSAPGGTAVPTAYDAQPTVLLLARTDRLEEVPFPSGEPALAVLVDVPGRRALIGRPAVLRSTFAQLMFLDGRYGRRFKKIAERSTSAGERVATYRIDWDGM
ncbi:MAG TPA: STT3 domain-containing protein [Candidatus Dormibacteraeota bacterium]|nr:STT3 domain-containing protein [Candidatus Dormibacteraeota bacterium]